LKVLVSIQYPSIASVLCLTRMKPSARDPVDKRTSRYNGATLAAE
jgi:hypothetical protein